MKSIQETFKAFIKESIAPNLRNNGLKGSGQNFYIPSETHWQLIGIQKSTWSNSEEIEFTVNLLAVSKAEWEDERSKKDYLPKKPSPNTRYGLGWSKRIGHLLHNQSDYWWTINTKTDLEELSKELIEAIVEKAIPALKEN